MTLIYIKVIHLIIFSTWSPNLLRCLSNSKTSYFLSFSYAFTGTSPSDTMTQCSTLFVKTSLHSNRCPKNKSLILLNATIKQVTIIWKDIKDLPLELSKKVICFSSVWRWQLSCRYHILRIDAIFNFKLRCKQFQNSHLKYTNFFFFSQKRDGTLDTYTTLFF